MQQSLLHISSYFVIVCIVTHMRITVSGFYELNNSKLTVAVPRLVPHRCLFLYGLVNTHIHIALESTQ